MLTMEKFTRNLLAHRQSYLSAIGVLAALSSYFASWLQYEQSVGYLFRTDQVTEAVNSDSTLMVLVGLPDELSLPAFQELRLLEQDLEALESVASVTSIFDARQPVRFGRMYLPVYPFQIESDAELRGAHLAAQTHPLIRKQLLSADGKWMRMLLELSEQGGNVAQIGLTLAPINALIERRLSDLEVDHFTTGLPSLQVAIAESLKRDQQFFIGVGVFSGWLAALLIFRNWRTVSVVVAGPALGLLVTFGLMGSIGVPINPINVVVAPLALTIALADAVHLQLEINRQRCLGVSRDEAIVQAMIRVGPACLLTAITTAIGFGALLTAEMLTVRELGLLGGATVIVALAAVLVLLPLLSSGFLGTVAARNVDSSSLPHRLGNIFVRLTCSAPKFIVLVGVISVACLVFWARELQPDISIAEGLPQSSVASSSLQLADNAFGGTSPLRLILSWDDAVEGGWSKLLSAVGELEMTMEEEPLLADPLSVRDLLMSLPSDGDLLEQRVSEFRYLPDDTLATFVNVKNKETYLFTSMPDAGSQALIPVLQRLSEKVDSMRDSYPQFKVMIEDGNVVHLHLADSLILSLLRAIISSVLLCSIVIALGTRSLKLGLLSLLPNLLVLAGTAGLMFLAGLPLQLTSMAVFTIAYGIGVDDTIHFLRHYQLSKATSPQQRVANTLRTITGPIVLTTLILVAGLSGVLFSEIPSLFHFGALFIGALIWALIGDLVLLPASLLVFSNSQGEFVRRDIEAQASPRESQRVET